MKKIKISDSLSTYLFPIPSFINGFAHAIDLGSNLNTFNFSLSEQMADYKAILSDWTMVGNDLENAIEIYSENNNLLVS